MGLKDAAKALMEQAGVPVVPGYHGDNQDPEHLAGAADTIGYPVLIKAVAGGGGKGMRLVERSADFAAALDSARGEAKTAFGNDAVLVEKFVAKPRHIEVQVFGDGTHAVHLFERDCSLQRRHQKVIEEAPAPGMTPEMREAMGQAGRARGRGHRLQGRGHGRVHRRCLGRAAPRPVLVHGDEHPPAGRTPGDRGHYRHRPGRMAVAGCGRGKPAQAARQNLSINGHAFEARLYAEDVPQAGFLPATGTLTHLEFPHGCRADSGVRAGDTISPWYDPMIAKVIVHGPTRAVALEQLHRALRRTQVAGTVTNLSFLGAI